MKEKITLEKLAQMVAKGFEQVDQRFEQVDQRFEQVDARFDQVDARFDRIEFRMSGLEVEIKELRKHQFEFAHLSELRSLEQRVSRLESER